MNLSNLYQALVVGKEKAIVAFVVGAAVVQASKHGLSLDMTLKEALEALLGGAIAHVSVFLTRNR
jgi:uncharacterized membrane protein (DUF441 family)